MKHATLALALLAAACTPVWRPRQARFVVTGCEATADIGPPEEWQWQIKPEPVLGRGPKGAWDAVDVLNPSVVQWNGVFYNLYSGFDGKLWHTGLATSRDGRAWERSGSRPVLSPGPDDYIAANGSVLHDGREFLYWYQYGRLARIRLARSGDAREWRLHRGPVLEPGPPGEWDESAVADPYVIRCGGTYYMYYLGQNRRGVQRLGVARSGDGVHWQKSVDNPLLDAGPPGAFDERGLGEPAVFRGSEEFYMIYTGRDRAENRRLGAARSADGIRWRRAATPRPMAGAQPWNSRVLCDPTLWAEKGGLWMWFGGGDTPSPDENLNGQIGLATFQPHSQSNE